MSVFHRWLSRTLWNLCSCFGYLELGYSKSFSTRRPLIDIDFDIPWDRPQKKTELPDDLGILMGRFRSDFFFSNDRFLADGNSFRKAASDIRLQLICKWRSMCNNVFLPANTAMHLGPFRFFVAGAVIEIWCFPAYFLPSTGFFFFGHVPSAIVVSSIGRVFYTMNMLSVGWILTRPLGLKEL